MVAVAAPVVTEIVSVLSRWFASGSDRNNVMDLKVGFNECVALSGNVAVETPPILVLLHFALDELGEGMRVHKIVSAYIHSAIESGSFRHLPTLLQSPSVYRSSHSRLYT